jgi:hypothetical protein
MYLEQNRPKFNADPENLKAYNTERDAALETMGMVHRNLPSYRVRGTINYYCPKCRLTRGVESTINPRGGGTKTADFWGCDTCGLEVTVERSV